MVLPILIIFDIDETLLQFINKKSYNYWEDVDPEQKNKFDYKDFESKKNVILFRPYLEKFLKYVNKNSSRVKIGVWTYSEREYAEDITGIITKQYGLSKNPFLLKYGTEDIVDHSIPKSLKQIWDSKLGKKFNKMNTILVDDRLSNLCHTTNKNNSIAIQGFEPFGYTKSRQPLTDENFEKAIDDTFFLTLIDIIKSLLKDYDGCTDEEIDEAFKEEAVFDKKRLKRTGLITHLNKIQNEDTEIEICSFGNMENIANPAKGGNKYKYKTKNKKYKNKKYKNKTNKR